MRRASGAQQQTGIALGRGGFGAALADLEEEMLIGPLGEQRELQGLGAGEGSEQQCAEQTCKARQRVKIRPVHTESLAGGSILADRPCFYRFFSVPALDGPHPAASGDTKTKVV
jgi:hypothetical protein